jgi:hypothetical protein
MLRKVKAKHKRNSITSGTRNMSITATRNNGKKIDEDFTEYNLKDKRHNRSVVKGYYPNKKFPVLTLNSQFHRKIPRENDQSRSSRGKYRTEKTLLKTASSPIRHKAITSQSMVQKGNFDFFSLRILNISC